MAKYVDNHTGNTQDPYNKVKKSWFEPQLLAEADFILEEIDGQKYEIVKHPDDYTAPTQIDARDLWLFVDRLSKVLIERLNGTYERYNLNLPEEPDIKSAVWGPRPQGPRITTDATLPSGADGVAYSEQLSASGDGTITWAVSAGTLPAGITLSDEGLLAGTPTEDGTFTFTIEASNSFGRQDKEFTLVIAA